MSDDPLVLALIRSGMATEDAAAPGYSLDPYRLTCPRIEVTTRLIFQCRVDNTTPAPGTGGYMGEPFSVLVKVASTRPLALDTKTLLGEVFDCSSMGWAGEWLLANDSQWCMETW